MKIIIPIGPKDADNLKLLVQNILAVGRVQQPILLVTVPSRLTEATQAQEDLLTVCTTVELVDTGDEFPSAGYMGANRMFHWVGTHLYVNGNKQGWLWLEPDCSVRPGWSDALECEYADAKQPYMGFVRPQKHKDEKGTIYFKAGDNMMMGVAIYSPQMLNDPEMLPLFNNLKISAPPAHPKYPWDIYLRWRFFKRGVHETPLMHDKWRTLNYRRENGKLVCDPDPEAPMGAAVGGAVSDAALLIHGCKDGTLQRLIISENSKPVAKPMTSIIGNPDDFAKVAGAIQDIRSEGVKPRVGDIAKRAGLSAADTKPILDQLGHVIGIAGWVTLKEEI